MVSSILVSTVICIFPSKSTLTYKALQPTSGQGLSKKIPPLYSILNEVHPVTGPKGSVIAVHAIPTSGFQSSLVLYAF
jgi:hypothetical protein